MQAPEFRAPKDWTLTTEGVESRSLIKFPAEVDFCDLLQPQKTKFSPVEIVKRIGSESSQGEVYQITYKNQFAALKLLPINSDQELEKNQNEIVIAEQASTLVKNGKCQNFSLVYGSGYCEDVYFFDKNWRLKGERYTSLKKMQKVLPSKSRHLAALFNQNLPLEEIAKKYELQIPQELRVPAHFLISELADQDLSTWAKKERSTRKWKNVILQVFEGLAALHEILEISHQDLHWANILIKSHGKIPGNSTRDLALIHDFGKSELLETGNEKNDLIKFLSSASALEYQLPEKIRNWFQESEKLVLKAEESSLDLIGEILGNL